MSNPFSNVDTVNAVVKVRSGPEIDRIGQTYEDGEIIYSTDKKRLFVGDDLTDGGVLVGNKVWVVNGFETLSQAQKYDTVYRTDTNSFYVLTGNSSLLPSSYTLVGGKALLTDNGALGYSLPDADTLTKGGIIVGNGLHAVDGLLSIDLDSSTLQIVDNKLTVKTSTGTTSVSDATYDNKGIVRVLSNQGLTVEDGKLSVALDNTTVKLSSGAIAVDPEYLVTVLPFPKATATGLGSIKLGTGLSAQNTTGLVQVVPANYQDRGAVSIGTGIAVDGSGKISVNGFELSGTDAFLGNKNSNGYQQFPSGMIFQWGILNNQSITGSSSFSITFPKTLTSSTLLNFDISIARSSNINYAVNKQLISNNTTGMTFSVYFPTGGTPTGSDVTIYWKIVGF